MKAPGKLFFAIVTFIALAGFQQPDNWYLHETRLYSIKFPAKPEFSSQIVPSEPKDMQMDIFMHSRQDEKDGNLLYQLLTLQYHDSLIHSSNTEYIDLYFRETIDAAVETSEGELIHEEPISMKGYPGREVAYRINESQHIVTLYIYLVEDRMIAAQAVTETLKLDNPQLQKFFKSFQIKGK